MTYFIDRFNNVCKYENSTIIKLDFKATFIVDQKYFWHMCEFKNVQGEIVNIEGFPEDTTVNNITSIYNDHFAILNEKQVYLVHEPTLKVLCTIPVKNLLFKPGFYNLHQLQEFVWNAEIINIEHKPILKSTTQQDMFKINYDYNGNNQFRLDPKIFKTLDITIVSGFSIRNEVNPMIIALNWNTMVSTNVTFRINKDIYDPFFKMFLKYESNNTITCINVNQFGRRNCRDLKESKFNEYYIKIDDTINRYSVNTIKKLDEEDFYLVVETNTAVMFRSGKVEEVKNYQFMSN